MLDDVAAIHDAPGTLGDEVGGALQNDIVGDSSTATHKNGYATCGLDDLVVDGDVGGRIRLYDVGTELDGLSDKRNDF